MQQATADQAFTNAKAAGDVNGMTAALIYRALERNTGKVGLASVPCTSIQAVNPEIAAIQQHQDPASAGAAATNKAITLELAKQIASIGGTASDALKSGTFAPGDVNDNTGKGNSCDDANDPTGCIFSQNLLVEDATVDEINAAVAGTSATGNSTSAAVSTNSTSVISAVSPSIASIADSASVSISTVTMMMTITQLQTDCAVATAPVVAAAATMPSPPMMASADVSSVVSAMMAGSTVTMDVSSVVSAVMAGQTSMASTDITSIVSAAMASQTVAAIAGTTVASTTAVGTTSAAVDCSGQIASALAAAGMAAPSAASSVATSSASPAVASSSTPFANTTTSSGSSSLDLGSCANPTIIFANGLDGRNEPAFAPVDETTFTHGSALGIKVITDFICQQLQTKCKASQATIDACNQGATAAQATSGQAAANAFNAALGF